MENLIIELKQGEVKMKKEYKPNTKLKEIINDFEDMLLSFTKKSLKNSLKNKNV